MQFPYAHKGVKKIFTAEILNIVVVIFLICSAVVALVSAALPTSDEGLAAAALVTLLSLISTLALAAVAFIIYLVGIIQAKRDERYFYNALVFVILPLIASIFAAIFSQNKYVQDISDMVRNISEVIAMVMIISGIRELAAKLDRNDMVNSANVAFRIIVGVYGMLIIARIIEFVFDFWPDMVSFAGIISLTASLINVFAHFYYLVYLGRAVKMLKE